MGNNTYYGNSRRTCPRCGEELSERNNFCPNCGMPIREQTVPSNNQSYGRGNMVFQEDPEEERRSTRKKDLSFIIIIVIVLAVLWTVFPKNNKESTSKRLDNNSNITNSSNSYSSDNTTPKQEPKKDYLNMPLGGIGQQNGIHIALNYVKRMGSLPTKLGEEKVEAGHEVIVAFFEICNVTASSTTASPGRITCYADGVAVSDVDTYIQVYVDGVNQFDSEKIEPLCKILTCQDFEVPKGWKELSFSYSSDCTWKVTQDDVKTDSFKFEPLIKKGLEKAETKNGQILYRYSDKYEVVFQGVEKYNYKSVFGNETYALFKFDVTNLGSADLDTSLMGHKMQAYQDGILLRGADYTISAKRDGYLNLFSVDKIAPGMTAKIYVAFEIKDTPSNLYMVYDDGFINENRLGTVFVKLKK